MSECRFIYPSSNKEEFLNKICGKVFINSQLKTITIGTDFRESGIEIANALSNYAYEHGVSVSIRQRSSTPEICWVSSMYDLAIMVTASHNPSEYNGIKVFYNREEIEMGAISSLIPNNKSAPTSYLKDCIKSDSLGLKVVCDTTNLNSEFVTEYFDRIGCELIEVQNILPTEPIYSTVVKDCVISHNADYGIFFDPDMDRVLIINADGEELTPDTIVNALSKYKQYENVLGTIDTSLNVVTSDIGRLDVISKMKQYDNDIGFEQSDHYYFKESMLSSDGMYAAYLVLSKGISKNTHERVTTLNVSNVIFPFNFTEGTCAFMSNESMKIQHGNEWIIFRKSETEKDTLRIIFPS